MASISALDVINVISGDIRWICSSVNPISLPNWIVKTSVMLVIIFLIILILYLYR